MTTVLKKTSTLPQQIRRQILRGVQSNPTALVEQILISITQQLNKPEYYINIEFSEKTQVIVSDYGPRSMLIEVTKYGDVGYVNMRYVVPKTVQNKKQIIRLCHYLLMHYKVDQENTRIQHNGPVQEMVVKKFIRSSLDDPPARWVQAAITTIDLH
jgi:hypothetical protein